MSTQNLYHYHLENHQNGDNDGKDWIPFWKGIDDVNTKDKGLTISQKGDNANTVIAGSETEESGQQNKFFCLF